MSVLNRVTTRLDSLAADSHCECLVCGARYESQPLNCAACGSTRFEN
ncbi:hypothetical protein [Halocalculus aciditolerans]|nr:hypothetical protein [Halocalculus aciditolerans]